MNKCSERSGEAEGGAAKNPWRDWTTSKSLPRAAKSYRVGVLLVLLGVLKIIDTEVMISYEGCTQWSGTAQMKTQNPYQVVEFMVGWVGC